MSGYYKVLCLALVVLFKAGLSSSKIADYVTICNVQDPDFNDCAMQSASDFFQKAMKDGVPEYDIPPLNQFYIERTDLKDGYMGVNITFKNATITTDEFIFTNANIEPENYRMQFVLMIPFQSMQSQYIVSGRVMMMPVYGDGNCVINMTDVTVVWELSGEPEIRDGVEYMKLTSFATEVMPRNMKSHFDNLFHGNKFLGNGMNKFLNTNWRELYTYIKPKLEEEYTSKILEMGGRFFGSTPYNEMFNRSV